MDTLGEIRVKLISHKTSLTLFLDTIQLHQSGKMATTLDNHGGQLDVILDKVDTIAARMGQRSGSIMTSYDDDDKEVWKQFRRELVAEVSCWKTRPLPKQSPISPGTFSTRQLLTPLPGLLKRRVDTAQGMFVEQMLVNTC
jgi:hypothetical protein